MVRCCITTLLLIASVSAAPVDDWTSRTVIYQLLTDRFALADGHADTCDTGNCPYGNYCGGTYGGIIERLDYIQDLGMNAVWISPIPANRPCGYHGYWAVDWDWTNEHFGDAADLKNLTATLHSHGMHVMVDMVANHNGPGKVPDGHPFTEQDHYHPRCTIDFSSQRSIERCWLVDLPDLNTENGFVSDYLADWVVRQVDEYGFDGIRYDTVPYVPKWHWKRVADRLAGGGRNGTYTLGEILIGNRGADYLAGYQYDAQYGPILDGLLNYPLYFALVNSFARGQSLWGLSSALQETFGTYRRPAALGNFVDNHDEGRFLQMNPSHALYMSALAVVMATTGVPIVYYGSEQGLTQDPDGSRGADNQKRQPLWRTGYNKSHPLYRFISRLARLRTQGLFDGTQRELWVLSNIYLFTRGERVLIVTSNLGDGQSLDITLPPSNVPDAFRRDGDITVCDLLLGDGQGRGEGDGCVRVANVNRDGLHVHIDGGMPQVLMVVSSTRQARRMPVLAK